MELPLTVTITARDIPQAIQQMRQEMAQLIRDVAAKEKDGAVVARLHEVAAIFAQTACAAEAVERVKVAPVTGLPRLAQTLARGIRPTTTLDVIGTGGGKATTETLVPKPKEG
jgi:hypothetical protein